MTPLFAQKQSGDRAFERLYKAHVQDVYRYALMVMRNQADAEDIAQTTFMKAYRAFQRGEQPRHPRQWLITIAHNTCRSHMRDGKRRPQEVELEEQFAAAVQTQPDDAVDPQELVRALGSLSFNQRAALVMRELEGRSYSEIAEVLELSSSAVETLLFRARRALREQLEGALSCGEAERALSLQLDGRLVAAEKGRLRAHLRECKECATLARRQRARQAALRSLGPLPLPASLASWGGGTIGIGLGAKAAALVAAGVAAVGTAQQAAEAVSEPAAHDRPATVAARVSTALPLAIRDLTVNPVVRRTAGETPERRTRMKSGTVLETEAAASPAAAARPGAAAAPGAAPTSEGAASAPAGGSTATVAVPVPEVPVKTPVQLPEPPPVKVEVPQVPQVPVPAPAPTVPQVPTPPPAPALPPVPPPPAVPPPPEVPKLPTVP